MVIYKYKVNHTQMHRYQAVHFRFLEKTGYNKDMKLIVGFGNPGNKYNFTRHNTGFLTLDFYFKINKLEWEKTPKFNALWAKTENAIFIKPQSYYNESGVPTRDFMHFFKIPKDDILVVCDDFNLEFGKLRYRERGSAGGNNGLKSVIEQLGTDAFKRLRIGTANDAKRRLVGDVDFVLGKYTEEERAQLPDILRAASSEITKFINN